MGCDIHAFVEIAHIGNEEKNWTSLCDYRFGRNYLLFALMAGVRRYEYLPDAEQLEQALSKRGVKKLDDPFLSAAEVETIVREASDSGITMGQPSFEEKGIPRNLGHCAAAAYTLNVVKDGDPEANTDGCCSETEADAWVSGGSSEIWDRWQDGTVMRVTGPDWHTPSWLDTEEMTILAQRLRASLEARIPDAKVEQDKSLKWAQNALERATSEQDAEAIVRATREVKKATRWATWNPLRDESLARVEALVALMQRLEADGTLRARVVFWFDN